MINSIFPCHVDTAAVLCIFILFLIFKKEGKNPKKLMFIFYFLVNTFTLKNKRIRSNDLEETEIDGGGQRLKAIGP